MDIVSYRGPNAPGGVSNVLQTVFCDPRLELNGWWFFAKNRFNRLNQIVESSPLTLAAFSNELVDHHYSYCNQYLWPMFHGFHEFAAYDAKLRLGYRRANRLLAQTIAHSHLGTEFFIHDYQLAMVPKLLQAEGISATSFFWHIPWPEELPIASVERALEIAQGISAAAKICFQTEKDANNFLAFCRQYCEDSSRLEERITVAPVPIDPEFWMILSQDQIKAQKVLQHRSIGEREKLVLSVERADYTKGVLERLHAIDQYLRRNEHAPGSIRFLQILPRTREGINSYDHYWQLCQQKVETINKTWGTLDWKPVDWIEQSLSAPELAILYARADVMLITSIADGLNLTAKEYVVCQQNGTGALVLSRKCGVSTELSSSAFLIDPRSAEDVVNGLTNALTAPYSERYARMRKAQEAVGRNSSSLWFARTGSSEIAKPLAKVT